MDYEEFAERFGGSGGVLGAPGGALPCPAVEANDASADEIQVVCARTAAVMESHGLQPDRLPALLALWGHLELATLASVLASLPLGLSRREAVALLGAGIEALAANMVQVQRENIWRNHLEWAQGQIPGQALRQVLQHQVIEAESRTLEPSDFMEALSSAGVPPGNIQMAIWLAQKTSQGDVQVASFLESFSGSPQASAKKKRGLLWRMMGR